MSDPNRIQRTASLDIVKPPEKPKPAFKSQTSSPPITQVSAGPIPNPKAQPTVTTVPSTPPPSDSNDATRGRSTSVYFARPELLDRLAKIGISLPRATASAVIQQLVNAFVPLAEELIKTGNTERFVTIKELRVYV